jgi:hypothetical protein
MEEPGIVCLLAARVPSVSSKAKKRACFVVHIQMSFLLPAGYPGLMILNLRG